MSDEPAGVKEVQFYFYSPSRSQYRYGSCNTYNYEPGTKNDITCEMEIAFPQFSESGDWAVDRIYLVDEVNNYKQLSMADVQALGLPTTLSVESIADTEPPELVNLAFSPQAIDVTEGDQTVSVSL